MKITLIASIATTLFLSLLVMPVLALSSLTNLTALDSGKSGDSKNIYVYTGPSVLEDGYVFGNCTWWVSYLEIQKGTPIPNTWGNAIDWADRAQKDGYKVDHTPSIDSIMQDPNSYGGLGHVALVTEVTIDGSWTISEMNYVGLDEVDNRTFSGSMAILYNFIHGKE